jgi:hypothetical protein
MPLLITHAMADTPKAPDSVEYRAEVYVSLRSLSTLLEGTADFTDSSKPLGLQPLTLTTDGASWHFPNGGDSIQSGDQQNVPLRRPVLVHQGQHYVVVSDLESNIGYQLDKRDGWRLRWKDRSLTLTPIRIDSAYHCHTVADLTPVNRTLVTTTSLNARRSLNSPIVETIPKGTTLIVRRTALLNGVPVVILTDCGPSFTSYMAESDAVTTATHSADIDTTKWAHAKEWFNKAAANELALCHGNRTQLERSACLTVDLCWSLRPFEPDLLKMFEAATQGDRHMAPVLFVSGRWTEQHPSEMHHLIDLSQNKGLDITWGLHSYEHPKTGLFMNSYTRDRLRHDTLRHEAQLLEWGLVPSVYYRFPGLIHDRERLQEILALDLFPIDCDSWSAIAARDGNIENKGPFGHPVTGGSIILVHGNGNEPGGIPPFRRWWSSHPDWALDPISRFLPTASPLER